MVANVSAIGCIGRIIVATRGEAGPARSWSRSGAGQRRSLPGPRSPLPKGTTVLVIEERGSRAVEVSAWDDPLAPVNREVRHVQ